MFNRGGVWHIRFSVTGTQLRRSLGTEILADAVTVSFNTYREVYAQKMGSVNRLYLSDAIDMYKRRIEKNKDQKNILYKVKKIFDYFGDIDLRLITVIEVQKWVDSLIRMKLKGAAINRYLAVLSGIFETARKSDPEDKYKIIKSTDFIDRFEEEPREKTFDIPTAMKILDFARELHLNADPKKKERYK
jgi:hypothetical protein